MIVINLTTTSSRLDLCSATLWSLINQSMLPDKIFVWISKDPYLSDKGIDHEPSFVSFLNSYKNIIEFRYTINTGPYRKLFPALNSLSDSDIIIYADDDVIYSSLWLFTLLSEYDKFDGEVVVASRVRVRNKNFFNRFCSYSSYPIDTRGGVFSDNCIITGVGGCVLQKKHINSMYLSDESFIAVAPKTDDLWISKIILLSGTKIKSLPSALKYVQEIQHSNSSLNMLNTNKVIAGGAFKLINMVYQRFISYLGIPLSNNDYAQIRIDEHFKKYDVE